MDKIYGVDGRMDKPVTVCFPFGEHKIILVKIKSLSNKAIELM